MPPLISPQTHAVAPTMEERLARVRVRAVRRIVRWVVDRFLGEWLVDVQVV